VHAPPCLASCCAVLAQDAANDDHSAKLYGHVTHVQFKQCLSVKVSGGRGGHGCAICSRMHHSATHVTPTHNLAPTARAGLAHT
jgi:hypothetical protein